jgi:hypothetical protein
MNELTPKIDEFPKNEANKKAGLDYGVNTADINIDDTTSVIHHQKNCDLKLAPIYHSEDMTVPPAKNYTVVVFDLAGG